MRIQKKTLPKKPLFDNHLYKDLAILSSSMLFLQVFGGLYRINLVKKVGPETMGLIGMVFPLYRMIISLVTLGLPTALARFVATDYAQGHWERLRQHKRTSFLLVTLMTALLASGLLLCSAPLGRLLYQDHRARPILVYLAPALLLTSLALIYKGYFRGLGETMPLALSEIGELLVESTFVLWLLRKTTPPVEVGVKILTTGYILGEISSLFILLLFDRFSSPHLLERARIDQACQRREAALRTRLLRASLPLLARSLILSISSLTDGVLIPRFLSAGGLTPLEATGVAGRYWGMTQPVAFFPLVFIFPLATIILPAAARATSRRELPVFMKKVRKLLLVALIYGTGAALLLLRMGDALSALLFKTSLPPAQLEMLIIALPLTSLNILLVSIAEGIGRQRFLLLLSLVLIMIKTGVSAALVPVIGISGAILALISEEALLTAGLLWELRKTGLLPVIFR